MSLFSFSKYGVNVIKKSMELNVVNTWSKKGEIHKYIDIYRNISLYQQKINDINKIYHKTKWPKSRHIMQIKNDQNVKKMLYYDDQASKSMQACNKDVVT